MNKTTNPYQTGIAPDFSTKQSNPEEQLNQFRREDDKAKAPLVMPFPLETVLVPLIGDVFITLTQARNNLIAAKTNPSVNKDSIKEIVTKIDEINKYVLDLQSDLRKITL